MDHQDPGPEATSAAPPASSPAEAPPRQAPLPLVEFPEVEQSDGLRLPPAYLVVDHCVRLSPGLALLQGWMTDPARRLRQLVATRPAQPSLPLVPGPATHGRPDVDDGLRPAFEGRGLSLPEGCTQGFFGLVTLSAGQDSVTVEAELDAGTPRRWSLPVQDDPAQAVAFMRREAAAVWLPAAVGLVLDALHELPEVMQERLGELGRQIPLRQPANSTTGRLEIDLAARIGDGLFLMGWGLTQAGKAPRHLLLRSEGSSTMRVVTPGHVARPDVVAAFNGQRPVRDQDLGLVAWVPGLGADAGRQGWSLLAGDSEGGLVERRLSVQDGLAQEQTVTAMLHSVPLSSSAFRRTYDLHTGPALESLFRLRRRQDRPQVKAQYFGPAPVDPEVSIIVPLYGRWDFMEYQIAQFVHDPELRRHELIYYVDDPSIYDGIVQYWRSTWPLYELPFTLAYAGENLGFAGANNAAATVAKGRRLLLLNSDVIPTEPGWISRLTQALDTAPQAGVVGPVLMYGDGAIQHAGMQFQTYPHWGDLWTNLHPGKGWPVEWVDSQGPAVMPALTGACMLMDAERYRALGGLDEGFIRGDFEDSDLCLKIRAEGLLPYLVPDVRLFHLERQSQDINARVDTRTLLTVFNCWRHTQRWGDTLQALSEETQS
ncbi:glycosyltransferase [Ideonella livida]|uniref:Glycosyltransferase n=1 Tax=Ideonella livida TaxID=2707176 RepID=A0A7C9PG98_9BURK|nr:glycosyltransferase [Ideonella livida]NDY90909.1 glycosyltransferase [Ideonella livida]